MSVLSLQTRTVAANSVIHYKENQRQFGLNTAHDYQTNAPCASDLLWDACDSTEPHSVSTPPIYKTGLRILTYCSKVVGELAIIIN